MAAIPISCPSCRHQFEQTDGRAATCPRCGQAIAVAADAAVEIVAVEAASAAPPPVPRWYILRDNRQTGPFSWSQMQRMVVAGQVQRRDLVWKEGAPGWVEARDVAELFPPPPPERDETMTAQVLEGRNVHAEPPPRPDSYRAGPAPWEHEPAPGAEFFTNLGVHIRRALAWNLGAMPVTDSEHATLKAHGIDNEAAQKYLAWRRSIFLIVAITTCAGAVLHIIAALVGKDFQHRSPFGIFTEIVRMLAQFVMPTTAILAYVYWSNVRLSRLLMVLGWSISFAVPVLIALFPFHWLFN